MLSIFQNQVVTIDISYKIDFFIILKALYWMDKPACLEKVIYIFQDKQRQTIKILWLSCNSRISQSYNHCALWDSWASEDSLAC